MIAPLHVAAKYGNINIVTLLVEKGSKIDIPNKVSRYMHLSVFLMSCNKMYFFLQGT